MIKFFCDKCGEELDRVYMYTGSICHPEIEEWDGAFITDPATFELCNACAKKLERFLQEKDNEEES